MELDQTRQQPVEMPRGRQRNLHLLALMHGTVSVIVNKNDKLEELF